MFGTGILVCGMHRSGTSALAGALHAYGATMGQNLLPPDNFNPKGYWELQEVMEFHEDLLKSLGLSGVSLEPLPNDWESSEPAGRMRACIQQLIKREFGDNALWAVKDPRLCRLISLWRQALEETPLRAILCVRHPLEVAGSLLLRDSYPWCKGLAFWLRYVLEAERNTRGMKRTLMRYEDLLGSPATTMDRIESELQVEWPDSAKIRTKRLQKWLEVKLNRNILAREFVPDDETKTLAGLCIDVYNLLQPDVLEKNQGQLDVLWNRLSIGDRSVSYRGSDDGKGTGSSAPSFTLAPKTSDPFKGVSLGSDWFWYHSSWFGAYNTASYPWIYHAQHGFMYVLLDKETDIYLYDLTMGWLYTNEAQYPNMYSFERKSYLCYRDANSHSRLFYNYSLNDWERIAFKGNVN